MVLVVDGFWVIDRFGVFGLLMVLGFLKWVCGSEPRVAAR
jgi:hypothetical protein